MKFAFVLFVISSAIVGLHGFAEPDQNAARDNVQNEIQELPVEESERVGYSHAMANAAKNRPPGRPSPVPGPLNLVECYVCADCPKVLENTTSKICSFTLDPAKRNKCVVYAEKYKQMKNPFYFRGCASERGSCFDIRKAHETHTDLVQLLQCDECDGDRCNVSSASLSIIDLTMAFFAMVVTPVIAQYTLS